VAKALGASPVILTGTRNARLAIGNGLGADRVININDENAVDIVKQLTGGIGADYVIECAGGHRQPGHSHGPTAAARSAWRPSRTILSPRISRIW